MSGNKASEAPRFNPDFTENVINATGSKASPRTREVMSCLIRHLHDFAREIELTVDEWSEGIALLNWAGQMSDDRRNEGQLVSDVVGLESLVDEIAFKKAAEATTLATQSAILGPFFQTDHVVRQNGDRVYKEVPENGEVVYFYGQARDATTQQPLANCSIDMWQASTNGLYEQQDKDQPASNLCGKFYTDENGNYSFYCLKPTPYPIPDDGPAGKLLNVLDRHPYRPAHVHLLVLKDGYKPIITQIFDRDSKYLHDDSVFAVKDDLVVDFVPREGDKEAAKELRYDLFMLPIN